MDNQGFPEHIAIIMDGNRRWARSKGLEVKEGHKKGAETLEKIVRHANKIGLKYITVYAFSTENWSRPKGEVDQLMKLFVELFDKYDPELAEQGIRVRFSGDDSELPQKVRDVCRTAEERSKDRPNMQLIVALNYGGRREILSSCKKIAEQVKAGDIEPSDITEKMLSDNMYLPDVPDPELIIRPSGEMRLSNFLLWESAYSEFWVSDILWPDFGYEELTKAFRDFALRDRRFGGLSKKESKK